MTDEQNIQYISADKEVELKAELDDLKNNKVPAIAKRIDEARQLGDLSENAEYHSARDEMAWAQSRIIEIENILNNSQIIDHSKNTNDIVNIGSTVVVKSGELEREYTIVGAQEADPLAGKISNESPLGKAFLGARVGDVVEVEIPAGKQEYEIIAIK